MTRKQKPTARPRSIRCANLLILITLSLLLAACQQQKVSFGDNSITLQPGGHTSEATIHANGALVIDTKAVDLTPSQQQLMQRYYQQVTAVHAGTKNIERAGKAMAKQGIGMAWESVKAAISGAEPNAQQQEAIGNKMQEQGESIGKQGKQLCQDFRDTLQLQSDIAAQIPSFAPYVNVDFAPHLHCGFGPEWKLSFSG